MTKIAIDFVLLFPDDINNYFIEINESLKGIYAHEIMLNKKDSVPHLSLCIGVIDDTDIDSLSNILLQVAQKQPKMKLNLENIKFDSVRKKGKTTNCKVELTNELNSLRADILKYTSNHLSYFVDKSMFYNPEEINETTIRWVLMHKEKSKILNDFKPHITLGFGKTNKVFVPKSFLAFELAIFQLGNNCTCRKKLFSIELKSEKEVNKK